MQKRKNLWIDIAHCYGIELEEQFHLEIDKKIINNEFRFSGEGLEYKSNGFWSVSPYEHDVLHGAIKIVKFPWRPSEHEPYYYIMLTETMTPIIMRETWQNLSRDIYSCMLDNCFRTREEAAMHMDEFVEKFKEKFYLKEKVESKNTNQKELWKIIAAHFGVKINEEFRHKHVGVLCRFTENGLQSYKKSTDNWKLCSFGEKILLHGNLEIVKLSWRPKENDCYWCVVWGADDKGCFVVKRTWGGSSGDYTRFSIGNCFDSKQEAEKNAMTIARKIRSRYDEKNI